MRSMSHSFWPVDLLLGALVTVAAIYFCCHPIVSDLFYFMYGGWFIWLTTGPCAKEGDRGWMEEPRGSPPQKQPNP